MELWVRSQDKESLTKVSNLSLQEIKHPVRHDTEYWGIGTYYDNLQMLGKYKTKERALEVLDEIQNILKPQMILSRVGKPVAETCDGTVYREHDEYDIKEISTYVYEMPEE